MPKRLGFLLAMAFFVMAVEISATEAEAAPVKKEAAYQTYMTKVRRLKKPLTNLQKTTWNYQRLMGQRLTPTSGRKIFKMSIPDLKASVRRWRWHANKARMSVQNVPHKVDWLCIHRYEGSWTDDGSPYYGGLQMDIDFQSRYGGWLLQLKGTADHWTRLEQMWVAERAYESGRGFYPWPNTARSCGLI